jgi:DNA-binding NarL/FixJ family response regulator
MVRAPGPPWTGDGEGPEADIRAIPEAPYVLRWHDPAVKTSVLIVDDHEGFRSRARAVLEADGYVVVGEAADGASAVWSSRELQPDVILLDVQLPDFDGFEVLRRLSAGGHLPAVVLTSSRDASDYGRRIAASGARGFIPKADLSGPTLRSLL